MCQDLKPNRNIIIRSQSEWPHLFDIVVPKCIYPIFRPCTTHSLWPMSKTPIHIAESKCVSTCLLLTCIHVDMKMPDRESCHKMLRTICKMSIPAHSDATYHDWRSANLRSWGLWVCQVWVSCVATALRKENGSAMTSMHRINHVELPSDTCNFVCFYFFFAYKWIGSMVCLECDMNPTLDEFGSHMIAGQ